MKATQRHAYKAVAERDDNTCQLCGRLAQDIAHILSRGRYPELGAEERNLVCLCRGCHEDTENPAGRSRLLVLMVERYEYKYDGEYLRYLR